MRVSIVYSSAYPGPNPGAKRIALYVRGLRSAGVAANVICTYRPTSGRVWCLAWKIIQPIIVVAHLVRRANKVDVIIAYGFGWVSLLTLRAYTLACGNRLVLELNELPGAVYANWFTEWWLPKTINRLLLSRLVLPMIDGFIVISRALEEFVLREVGAGVAVIRVPILIDTHLSQRSTIDKQVTKPFLLHSGALSDRKDGIVGVFEAFAKVNVELSGGLHFYLTDSTAPHVTRMAINTIVRSYDLQANVHFLGMISEEELIWFQRNCSMLILNKPDNDQNRHNFPTKIGEYLRERRPIIFTPVGEMASFLTDGVNAIETPVDRPDILAKKIRFVLENPVHTDKLANHGYELAAAQFDFRNHGGRLATFISNLVT